MAVASAGTFSSLVSAAEFGIRVQDPIEHLQHCHQRIEDGLVTVKDAVAGLCLTQLSYAGVGMGAATGGRRPGVSRVFSSIPGAAADI